MKQKLRAEIFSSIVEMGKRHLPIDPTMYEAVRQKLLGLYSHMRALQ
jgi:hypothetical protein